MRWLCWHTSCLLTWLTVILLMAASLLSCSTSCRCCCSCCIFLSCGNICEAIKNVLLTWCRMTTCRAHSLMEWWDDWSALLFSSWELLLRVWLDYDWDEREVMGWETGGWRSSEPGVTRYRVQGDEGWCDDGGVRDGHYLNSWPKNANTNEIRLRN